MARSIRVVAGFIALSFILAGAVAYAEMPGSAAAKSALTCSSDSDCVPAVCCHASACVHNSKAPDCSRVMCTQDCQPGTIDCGGDCYCDTGACKAHIVGAPSK